MPCISGIFLSWCPYCSQIHCEEKHLQEDLSRNFSENYKSNLQKAHMRHAVQVILEMIRNGKKICWDSNEFYRRCWCHLTKKSIQAQPGRGYKAAQAESKHTFWANAICLSSTITQIYTHTSNPWGTDLYQTTHTHTKPLLFRTTSLTSRILVFFSEPCAQFMCC
jgi:hypothetical protein